MRRAILLLAATAVVAARAECPHWISVMPLHTDRIDELAADAVDLGNTTLIDGVVWSCAVHPAGDPAEDKAKRFAALYKQVAEKIRAQSKVQVGVLLQATMGHSAVPAVPAKFQRVVKPDGRSFYRMCPLDPGFLDYIAGQCRTFSDVKPDFFMIDDDTRLTLDPDATGCYCPLHLAEFAKRTGRTWTREEAVAAVKGDPKVAAEWERMTVGSLEGLFRTIRANFDAEIPGILCVCCSPHHIEHARHYAEILTAPGQTPMVRCNGAPFHNYGKDLLHIVEMRSQYARQRAQVGRGALVFQEADTCPHTLWMSSATRLVDHMVMLALDGFKGAKIWITRTACYHEKKSANAYRRAFRENRGLMKWAADVDYRQTGVVVPELSPTKDNFGDRYLGLMGIPYRFGAARPDEITALTAETLANLPRERIAAILAGKVVADGPAAVWLAQNGFAADIGVRAKPWALRTIQRHECADGGRLAAMRVSPSMADLNAREEGVRVLSWLCHLPRPDAQPEREAPGATRFGNARGGDVLLLAQPIPDSVPISYAQVLLTESAKTWFAGLLADLGGGMPGGLYYNGVGPATCLSGTAGADGQVFVLNLLDLDGDDAPEFVFDEVPTKIERLRGDGTWENVDFAVAGKSVTLKTKVETQRPGIFKVKSVK